MVQTQRGKLVVYGSDCMIDERPRYGHQRVAAEEALGWWRSIEVGMSVFFFVCAGQEARVTRKMTNSRHGDHDEDGGVPFDRFCHHSAIDSRRSLI